MAQALFDRLNVVFSDAPEQRVVAERAHWPGGMFARRIDDVRSVVVHETSGMPARAHGEQMFYRNLFGGNAHAPHTGETTQLYIAGDGTVLLGMTLPLRTWHANFVNHWALGCETGHGWGNYGGNDHLGPLSQSDHTTNADGEPIPPYGQFRPLHAMPGNAWIALSDNPDPNHDDIPGVKFWFRLLAGEVIVGLWTTERYAGPWRQEQRVSEMLFSEAQYRSWALLARYLAEQFLVPRNFPVLPHKMRSTGFGVAGGLHGTVRDAVSFLSIVRADEALSRSAATFGLAEPVFNNDAQVAQAYRDGVQHVPAVQVPGNPALSHGAFDRNNLWTRLFNGYRGFHGHGYSGDPHQGRDHDCPGPMFDWHRFAREVWDWWWHPFDFDNARATTNVPRRPYSRNWDGNTRLTEHYFDIPPAVYTGRRVPGIHGNSGSPRTYRLESGSPVYALANGELVAARFPAETGGVSLAFTLVRHEVFHQPDTLALLPDVMRAGLGLPPVLPDRISYDAEPSTVYSLYMHLGRPDGMSFDNIVPGNPAWLNRLLMRKKECELGVAYLQAHPPNAQQAAAWNSRPPGAGRGAGPRPTIREGWVSDDGLLRPRFDQLRRGEVMIAPSPDLVWATPIRVLLGDFLGNAGVISRTHAATTHGVRIEVFSKQLLSQDFDFTASDAVNRWNPTPTHHQKPGGPAVLYPSEWWDIPAGDEKTAFEVNGVDVSLMDWIYGVETVTTLSQLYPADGRLPRAGGEVHYDPDAFMQWINRRTWRSEWPKYRATDPAGVPAQPRPR